MSRHDDQEVQALLEALAVLEAGTPEEALAPPEEPGLPPEEAGTRETLRRLGVETLGLVAYGVEPAEPRAGARERMLGALGGSGRAAGAPSPPRYASRPRPRPRSHPGRASWLAAVAASLLLLAVAGLAGWLYTELDRTRTELTRLETERERLARRLDAQGDLIRRAGGSGELLAAVATPGVEVCPLRPVGDPPMMPAAYAVLYMPPGSDEWYLLASNLEPDRGVYKVWLNTPDGPMPAGILRPGEAETLEFRLPPAIAERHELVLSIAVTVEPSPDMPEPEGPMVLFGDEKMTVL